MISVNNFQAASSENFNVLIELAKKCDPSSSHLEQLERKHTLLHQRLWDLRTTHNQRSAVEPEQTMTVLLPHYPHAKKVNLLPSCFDRNTKVPGLLFIGDDLRTVEYLGYTSSTIGLSFPSRQSRSSQYTRASGNTRSSPETEVVVTGNTVIPFSQIPEYYFEITIGTLYFHFLVSICCLSNELFICYFACLFVTQFNHFVDLICPFPESLESGSTSSISIGFCPENQVVWGPGSYRYQTNRYKTYYDKGKIIRESYGKDFAKVKTVVGTFLKNN
jgi:hypothetical protein